MDFDLQRFVTAQDPLFEQVIAELANGQKTSVDAAKLRSSMTLFALASADPQPFVAVLDAFYGGAPDPATLTLLGA